jgi:hypothetical protein
LSAPPENYLRISPEYQQQQQQLHAGGNYGNASLYYAPMVSQIINRMGVTHLLDYGCGESTNLAKSLKADHKLTYQAFDPAVPRFAKEPLPAEMVACIDVLEHVEPVYLESVLNDLVRLTEGIIFATVGTAPAQKNLPDGRNAHLTQRPMQWWLPKLWDRFDLQTYQVVNERHFLIIGQAKVRLEAQNGDKII